MQLPGEKIQKELPRIKKNVERSHAYWSDNIKCYNEFMEFVFKTSLTATDLTVLEELGKPEIEQNILEAYVSRLAGEFSKQIPSFEVGAAEGQPVDSKVIEAVRGHLLAVYDDFKQNGGANRTYREQLGGGFSVWKLYTDYANSKSFEQNIYLKNVFDPTMCGFDPVAIMPHKGDGRYSFELFPKTKDDFLAEFSGFPIDEIKFCREEGSFNWSYKNQTEEILLYCDYYEKKNKRIKIYKLSDGRVLSKEDYEELIKSWKKQGILMAPPVPVQERYTKVDLICRYEFVENKILRYTETNLPILPHIFVDGNSVTLRESNDGASYQKTRPYVYQAKGTQRLKNFSLQTLANDLENMVQHKWIFAKETIDPEYKDAIINPQKASTLVYSCLLNKDPQQQLPAPREVQRVPAPPEVMGTVQMTDQMVQNTLGSFDSTIGKINENDLSGIALIEAATQSNSAAMPYVISYMQAMNHAAQGILGLIPKYFVTPRSIPVILPDGKRDFQVVNAPGAPHLKYDDESLKVRVEAGPNFSVQKTKAFNYLRILMQISPDINALLTGEEGLPILLKNVEFQGVEELKDALGPFFQKKNQMQQMQQQQIQAEMQEKQAAFQQMQQKQQLEMAKFQQSMQQDNVQNNLRAAEISQKNKDSDIELLKLLTDKEISDKNAVIQLAKAHSEMVNDALKSAHSEVDLHHRHAKETIELLHKVSGENKHLEGEHKNG